MIHSSVYHIIICEQKSLFSFVILNNNIIFFSFISFQDIFSGTTHLSDSSTLILDRVDRHHAGVYQCAADNGVREPVSMDIHLTILCKRIHMLYYLFSDIFRI